MKTYYLGKFLQLQISRDKKRHGKFKDPESKSSRETSELKTQVERWLRRFHYLFRLDSPLHSHVRGSLWQESLWNVRPGQCCALQRLSEVTAGCAFAHVSMESSLSPRLLLYIWRSSKQLLNFGLIMILTMALCCPTTALTPGRQQHSCTFHFSSMIHLRQKNLHMISVWLLPNCESANDGSMKRKRWV